MPNDVEAPVRQENPFGSAQLAKREATSVMEVAAQREIAEVQAAVAMAKRFPRDPIAAMDRILLDCTRPTLADAALYEYAKGGTNVTGPSIRLAEVLAQRWGNISCGVVELARGNGQSECLAYAWDLETNFRDEKRFTVRHWRDTKKGGYQITDERDIYELVANMGARRKRACILAVIPGDVQEAAIAQCETTLKAKVEVTPEVIASMLEKFAEYGVVKEQIEARIQRRIEAITPAGVLQLRKIYNSLRDGMSSPIDYFDPLPTSGNEPAPTTGAQALKQAAKGKGKAEAKAPADDAGPDLAAKHADILRQIREAKTGEQLDLAADLGREYTWSQEQAEALIVAARERRAELEKE